MNDTDRVSVAKMSTRFDHDLEGAMNNSQVVNIQWAKDSKALTCEPLARFSLAADLPSQSYQTCLIWSTEASRFLFFSSLDLKDTLELSIL